LPPSPPPPEEDIEEIEDEDVEDNLETPTANPDDEDMPLGDTTTDSEGSAKKPARVSVGGSNGSVHSDVSIADLVSNASRSRGNGKGRKNAKDNEADRRMKARRVQALEDLKTIQEKRLKIQEDFATNQKYFQQMMMLKTALEYEEDETQRMYLKSKITDLLVSNKTINVNDTSAPPFGQPSQSATQTSSQSDAENDGDRFIDLGNGISVPAHLLDRED
jgi:hypothetical protein